jgi:ferredoxin
MTVHKLTIDRNRCRGLSLCHACSAIQPGLVESCQDNGEIVIMPWANRDCSEVISALIACCPDRAIRVSPK